MPGTDSSWDSVAVFRSIGFAGAAFALALADFVDCEKEGMATTVSAVAKVMARNRGLIIDID